VEEKEENRGEGVVVGVLRGGGPWFLFLALKRGF